MKKEKEKKIRKLEVVDEVKSFTVQ